MFSQMNCWLSNIKQGCTIFPSGNPCPSSCAVSVQHHLGRDDRIGSLIALPWKQTKSRFQCAVKIWWLDVLETFKCSRGTRGMLQYCALFHNKINWIVPVTVNRQLVYQLGTCTKKINISYKVYSLHLTYRKICASDWLEPLFLSLSFFADMYKTPSVYKTQI